VADLMPYIFLGVILKIPVALMIWLVWWAMKAHDNAGSGGGGKERPVPRHKGPRPGGPLPRRGPHPAGAKPLPDCPPGGRTRRPRKPIRLPERKPGIHEYPFR
jgi:hypothetical protein